MSPKGTLFQNLRSSNLSARREENQRADLLNRVRDNRSEEQKIGDLIKAGGKMIFKMSTIFPFDFFPDDITIDPLKVNHTNKIFFFTEQVNTYLIDNIKSVTMENFLIFSKLVIYDDKNIQTGVVVGPFLKKKAIKAFNIIQGLMAASKRAIDPTQITSTSAFSGMGNMGLSIA